MDLMATAQLLGNVGEFLGAAAVFVTLGYLAVQVRQNSKSLDASTSQELIAQMNAVNISLIETEAAMRDWYDYLSGGQNKESRVRGEMVARCYANHYLQAYLLHKRGALQEEIWNNIDQNMIAIFSTPGGRFWLESWHSSDLPRDLLNHVRGRQNH